MGTIKFKISLVKMVTIIVCTLVAGIFLVSLYAPLSEEWSFRLAMVISGLALAFLIFIICVDVIEKQYSTLKYIVLTEIIVIIIFIIEIYINITMMDLMIFSDEYGVLQIRGIIAKIALMAAVMILALLRREKFKIVLIK